MDGGVGGPPGDQPSWGLAGMKALVPHTPTLCSLSLLHLRFSRPPAAWKAAASADSHSEPLYYSCSLTIPTATIFSLRHSFH